MLSQKQIEEFRKIFTFGLVGILNTGVFTAVVLLVKLTGIHYAVYTLAGYMVSIPFSFFMNRRLTFRVSGPGRTRMLVKFTATAFGLVLMVQGLQYLFISVGKMPELVGVFLAMVLYTATGYILNRTLVFKSVQKAAAE